jgi:hypothetical protein
MSEFDGPPEYDQELTYLVEKHRFPDGSEHFGNLIPAVEIKGNNGEVRDATWDDWNNPDFQNYLRKEMSLVTRPGKALGLGVEYYAAKDTFKEDAGKCYQRHNRPTEGCSDYRSDSKRLIPDTKRERREIGLDKPRSNRSLCEFCVVHVWVQEQLKWKAGLYE